MPSVLSQVGAYPLTGTGRLPNVDVASPGEVWSHRRANGVIVPGSCVRPIQVAGVGSVVPVGARDRVVADGDGIRQQSLAIAMRQIMVPDINPGSQYNLALGPNEIVNLPIADQDYVRTYHTGVVHLTLVMPARGYEEGDIIGWAPLADRPALKTAGHGAWARMAVEARNAAEEEVRCVEGTGILVVDRPARYYGAANEALLTCRFLRSNQ